MTVFFRPILFINIPVGTEKIRNQKNTKEGKIFASGISSITLKKAEKKLEIEVQERQIEDLEKFIQRVHKYEDLQEMTPYALRELVKGIYIEAPDKSSGKRRQGVRISYDLVGFVPVEELLKQETA